MQARSGPSANLDLVRSVAVLLVLGDHVLHVAGLIEQPTLKAWGLTNLGQLGVLLFFIHTSLVLMFSCERLVETESSGFAWRFYVRRLFRIYPLSVFVVLGVVVLGIPAFFEPVYTAPSVRTLAANLLLVQNVTGDRPLIGPLWSLPYEVQMYVLLPALFLLARRARTLLQAYALVLVGFAMFYVEGRLAHVLGYPRLLGYAPWFGMGIAAYAVARVSTPKTPAGAFAVALGGLIGVTLLAHRFIANYRAGWAMWAGGVVFALWLPQIREIGTPWLRGAGHWIATLSYGIYLLHVPILWFAFYKLSLPVPVAALLATTLLVGGSAILHYALERPAMRLGARLSSSRRSLNHEQPVRAAIGTP